MKVVESLVMRVAPWAAPVLTIGIFIFDLLTPVGMGIPILYVIPLALTLFTPRERDPIVACLFITSLIWVGLVFGLPGTGVWLGVLNRALGTFVVWSITLGLFRYKKLQRGLIQAEIEKVNAERNLMLEQVERAHAEGLMVAAQEARSLADTATLGAVASRQEAEEKLRVNQLRLEGMIQSAMDAIITVDEQQRVVLFNQAAERMFGWPAEKAIGQMLDQFIPVRFRDAHREQVKTFGQSGSTSRRMGALGQVSGLRADGTEFLIEAAISHNTIEGQKFYTVILRDISEHKRMLEELRRQHEFTDAILETAGALVVVLDRQGKILRFNRACERTTGYSSEEVTGKTVWDFLLVPEDVEPEKKVFARLRDGEPHNEYENEWVSKDGHPRRITWSNTVITDERGSVEYVVGTGIDVTPLNQMQEQLRKTERLAELGTLASGMAHEIGTPMNVILGRAEYLMDRVNEEPIKKSLQTIVVQVERITKVMNQLLTFARRKPPDLGPLAFKNLVEDNLELFRERLAKSRVAVELALDETCPKVRADPDQMSQVLINLIMNALHAMEDGGTLRICVASEKDMVRLTVADTGRGIPPEAVKKIFEPFFTTKEFGKGTGLGLTVVRGIIEEHQGSITVESEPGRGTIFAVLLPVASSS